MQSTFGLGIGADCQAIPMEPSDPRDLMFRTLIGFTPPEWGVATDADVPDGAIVARLSSTVSLGLGGAGCDTRLFPEFTMMDATTDTSTQVPLRDPEKEFDPPDRNDSQGTEPDDQFDLGPDNLPLGVTRYPDYLTRIFRDPEGNALTPISRFYGQTELAGIELFLGLLVFEPGTVFLTPAGDTIVTDPRLGYPSAIVVQSAGDPDIEADIEENNVLSDSCSPIQIDTTVFGVSRDNPDTAADEGGFPVRTNPPDGTYFSTAFALSQYDADGDGIETPLDPCPTIANPNWDPRLNINDPAYTGDQDRDLLPDECDPDPYSSSPFDLLDEDEDRYWNRSDNCPLVANSAGQLGGIGADNQADSDGDGIGDACDPNPDTPDGQRFHACVVSQVTVGAGGAPPLSPLGMQPCDPNASLPGEPTPTDAPTPTPTPTRTPTPTPTPAPTPTALGVTVAPTTTPGALPATGGRAGASDSAELVVGGMAAAIAAGTVALAAGAWYARRRWLR